MTTTEISSSFQKKFFGLTFVLFLSIFAIAQEKHLVTGKITDAQNQPVPYASVTFSHKTNKLFSDAALTDDKGTYTLNLANGNYDVTIEAIDFKKKTITKLVTSATKIEDITIESEATITNTKTQEIQGVTITAANKPYRVELDKKVYDVTADITSKGGNLQDVLQNVPSVSVETDGTVSMRGNSNVRFLINGKPSSLLGIDDGANALQSIPADQIERIEVITNPSSKFESAGTAGILNIILKKSKKMGFNGSVEGTLGYLPTTRLNTNLSWKKGNLTYYINGGGGYNESKNVNRNTFVLNTTLIDPLPGTILDSKQESENTSFNKNYNVTTGIVYDINEKSSFNISGMLRGMRGESDGFTSYIENQHQFGTLLSTRNNTGNNKNFSYQFDAGMDHKFNTNGHQISFAGSLQNSNSDGVSTVTENAVGYFAQNIINQITKNATSLLKVDYELPIGEKSKLEAGSRFDYNKNDYDYSTTQSENGSPFVVLQDYTSKTIYNENILAVYTQFKSKLTEKLGYQIGLRAENTKIDLSFLSANGTASEVLKNYTNYFPTVFLSYDISRNNQFLLNYSQRIRRPRSFFLIPFMSYNDNRNIFTGNPELDPSIVDSYEFGYSLQKNKFTINPTLYYKNTKDDIKMYQERTIDSNGNTVIKTRPINIGTEETYGLDLNTTLDIYKWWKVMANVDLFGYKTSGQFGSMNYSGDGFSTRLRLTNTFRPNKKTNFQIQTFFRGAQKTASMEQKPMYAVSLGGSRTIWDGNGTLSFNVQDIFNTRARRMITTTDIFYRDSYMQMMPRQFTVSLTYRFKEGEKVEQPKRKRDINNNDQGGDDGPPM